VSDEISKSCFAVFDHFGLFVGLAERLAKSGARVLYCTPVDRYDRINEGVIGSGIEGVEWCEEFWQHKHEIDTFVFPDIRHNGLQAELLSQGFAVWGSQSGMDLEQKREFFMRKLGELGLPVAPHKVVVGLENLSSYLKDKKDIWIKVSKWRGTWETTHWRSWDEDAKKIHHWYVKFGGESESVRFICFDKIDTKLEIGADTFCVDGQWPETMLHGIESKDKSYFSAVTPRYEMPEQLLSMMEALSPYFKEVEYKNQWSMEVRVGDKDYFIDATSRGGLPSTRSFLCAKNVPEIIYHGARGKLIQPDYGFKFSAECMVEYTGRMEEGECLEVVYPPEVREHLMLQQCYINEAGKVCYPPSDAKGHKSLGWLVATGNTPKEVFDKMKKLADELPDGLNAEVEDLASVVKEVEEMEKQGIKFTSQKIPEPSSVL
jgi:hypothetical protein